MKQIEELSDCKVITKLYPYYRADVFAAHLIETGCDMEHIIISRKDGHGRGFMHDINRVSIKYPNLNPESPYLDIESGRMGIYDSLPEDLFYRPDHTQKERDRAAIVARFRANKQAEQSVRRFLKLFEVEADQVLSYIQTKNLRYDKSYTYRESSDIFRSHWEVISLMSQSEAQRFLKVVPYVAQIRGKLAEMAAAMSFILDVRIEAKYEYCVAELEVQTPCLSDMYLDDNSVLNPHKNDVRENPVLLTVSGLSLEACRKFFEGQKKDAILRFLFELLFDVNTSFRIEIKPKTDHCHFVFGVADNEPYLDVNTYL